MGRSTTSTAIWLLAATAAAHVMTSAPSLTASAPTLSITAVTDCHPHDGALHCKAGTEEYRVIGPTRTEEFASQYTGCHANGDELECHGPDGEHVEVIADSDSHAEDEEHHSHDDEDTHEDEHTHEEVPHSHEEEHSHDKEHSHDEEHSHEGDHSHEEDDDHAETSEIKCHFHAGVEHCEGGNAEAAALTCSSPDRDYNIPLRVGLLFVILVTGGIGAFTPILATTFTRMSQKSIIFVILKQFGTGVVLSTAFIHLFTHAHLLFTNDCLGDLAYESTTAAVFLAGLFLSFLVDYIGARYINWRKSKTTKVDSEALGAPAPAPGHGLKTTSTPTSSALDVHSDDNSSHANSSHGHGSHEHHIHHDHATDQPTQHGHADEAVGVMALEAGMIFHSVLIGLTLVVAGDSFFLTLFAVIIFHQMFEGIALGTCIAGLPLHRVSFGQKMILAAAFTITTPIGMAIGIGVLKNFNGNDPSTIIAIGTLDALSAGILAWVGIVEMLARDWLHGRLLHASILRNIIAMISLIAGLVLMSVLGKWT